MMPLHRLAALLSFSWILGLLIILTTPAAKMKKNHSSILVWTYNVCAVGNLPNPLVILRSTPTSQIIHESQQLREKNGHNVEEKPKRVRVDFTEKPASHFKLLPQCPGGRPPPAGCKMHDSGKAFVKGEPEVWPCNCAAQWRVRLRKPQSGNTCP